MNRGSWFSEILDYLQSPYCTLKVLDLGYNDLNPSLMTNLVQVLPISNTLQKLDLQDNILGLQASIELGKILPELRHLQTLILRNCNIGSTYASHIFTGLILNYSIEILDLQNNSIGDNASSSLSNLIKIKTGYLRLNINLRSNQISNTGFEKIKQSIMWHMQSRNTREIEQMEPVLPEEIDVKL